MTAPLECLCCPDIGFTCRLHDGSGYQAIAEETRFPSNGPPWDVNELPPELQGYGHRGADQDGYTGEEWIKPAEHKEQEFFEALKIELDAQTDTTKP